MFKVSESEKYLYINLLLLVGIGVGIATNSATLAFSTIGLFWWIKQRG